MVFRNTLAQSAPTLLGLLAGFLLAPLLLSRLGLAAFGVWAVTGALAMYLGIADLGVSRYLSRFVALYDARGDNRAIRECTGLGLIIVTILALLGATIAVVAAPLVRDALGELSVADMRIVLLSAAAILAFQAYRGVFASVPLGLRRMVPPSVGASIGICTNFGFSVGILLVSPTLVNYALANAAAELLSMAATFISLLYVWSPPPLALPSRPVTREVLGYGLKAQVNAIAELVNAQTDKVILAMLVGVRAAGAYEIAARLVAAVRLFGLLTVSAMIPTATAHIVEHGREAIRAFYRHYLQRSVAIAFPLFVLTAVTGGPLLVAWLDEVPPNSEAMLVVLTLAYLVNTTTAVGMTVTMGAGQPGIVASNAALAAGMNIAFTVALAPLFGLWGVLAGTFVAISGASVLFVLAFHRTFSVPGADFLRAVGVPAALAGGLALPFLLWGLLFGWPVGSRADAVLSLALIVGLYGPTYLVLASRLGLLPSRLTVRWAERRQSQASSS